MLIAFEGVDGSGKSTQARLLHKHLLERGVRAELTAEPTRGSEVGMLLRKELRSRGKPDPMYLQLLFTADRAWHVANFIKPAIDRGAVVITDRYMDSTRAYGSASGLDAEWLAGINGKFPKADITLFMDVEPDEAMRRLGAGRDKKEIFDNIDFLSRVRSCYISISMGHDDYHVVDAGRSEEAVQKEIASIVDGVMTKR